MVFKLRTSEKPFALIKIGDISGWLKDQLEGYEINESFDNESVFRRINRDDSDVNILMGSRSFYEGWDSNRPNLLLFINIGVGSDAKKFVLQSVGRGIRIEPEKNKRKRLKSLYNARKIREAIFRRIKKSVLPLETLFVFGTNAKALHETMQALEEEKGDEHLLSGEFIKNKKAEELPLFIPVYKLASYTFAEKEDIQKFSISQDDLALTKKYIEYLEDDRVILMNHESDVKTLEVLHNSFRETDKYYDRCKTLSSLLNPSLTFSQIIQHLLLIPEEFDKFKKLENEIVHFKKIKFIGKEKLSEFLKKIKIVRSYEEREEELKQLRMDFEKHKDINRYDKERERLDKKYPQSISFDSIKIEYIPNHYYLPIILSEKEKIDYLNHIITTPSEVRFIEKLEEYLGREDNLFNQFDWWLFSKLDEYTDEVYIPWYNPKRSKIDRFKPDFIFWLKKGKNYFILFIDPKGTEHAEAYRKIDGFINIFEDKGESKVFRYNGLNIKVKLFLRSKDTAYPIEKYRDYWFDDINNVLTKIKTH
jgi:hypothetical protein